MYLKTIRRDWVIFDLVHQGLVSSGFDLAQGIRGWAASLQRAMVFKTPDDAQHFAKENKIYKYVLLSTNDIDVPNGEQQ